MIFRAREYRDAPVDRLVEHDPRELMRKRQLGERQLQIGKAFYLVGEPEGRSDYKADLPVSCGGGVETARKFGRRKLTSLHAKRNDESPLWYLRDDS